MYDTSNFKLVFQVKVVANLKKITLSFLLAWKETLYFMHQVFWDGITQKLEAISPNKIKLTMRNYFPEYFKDVRRTS